MAIELIPKRERKPLFGQLFFLIISIAVLGGAVASYFILQLFIDNAAEELATLEKTFLEDTRPLEEELSREVREYKKKTDLLRVVLDERRTLLPFFGILEATTHPDVFFRSFQGDTRTGVFSLQGDATNFSVLEQQRLVWNQQHEYTATLQGMSLGSGGIATFQVEFVVNADVLLPL